MEAFWVSLGVVFLAELGDKSQLLALSLAARYPALPVFAGIAVATAAMQAVSVTLGRAVAAALPARAIGTVAGLAFLGFAAWTLWSRNGRAARVEARQPGWGSAMLTAAMALVVAEAGDKTMLAAISLAATYGALPVWAGATLGMLAAVGLAVLVGRQLVARLAARTVRIAAAVGFAAVGVFLLLDALAG